MQQLLRAWPKRLLPRRPVAASTPTLPPVSFPTHTRTCSPLLLAASAQIRSLRFFSSETTPKSQPLDTTSQSSPSASPIASASDSASTPSPSPSPKPAGREEPAWLAHQRVLREQFNAKRAEELDKHVVRARDRQRPRTGVEAGAGVGAAAGVCLSVVCVFLCAHV